MILLMIVMLIVIVLTLIANNPGGRAAGWACEGHAGVRRPTERWAEARSVLIISICRISN